MNTYKRIIIQYQLEISTVEFSQLSLDLNRAEQLEKDLISLSFSSPFQLSQQPNELSQKQTRRRQKQNKKNRPFFKSKQQERNFPASETARGKGRGSFWKFSELKAKEKK